MYIIWLGIAAFCLLYFCVCVICAGFKSAFNFVWLFAAIASLAVFALIHGEHKGIIHIPVWLKACATVIFAIGMAWLVILECCVISRMRSYPEECCDYIIVLGAHVKGDVVSQALQERLDAAYEYASKPSNESSTIIVAGGQGRGENVTEAYAMKQYLVNRGIRSDRILMEDKSTDTNENLQNSIEWYISDNSSRVVVVSNNFHIYRTLRLAKAKGLSNAEGLAAPCRSGLLLCYMVREAVGITKEIVFGNF